MSVFGVDGSFVIHATIWINAAFQTKAAIFAVFFRFIVAMIVWFGVCPYALPRPFTDEATNYFNPLSPYGERPTAAVKGLTDEYISIPSPHTGRDPC